MSRRSAFNRLQAGFLKEEWGTVRSQAQVSDHALLRWLERVEGENIDGLKRAILSDTVLPAMALGASGITLPEHRAHLILKGLTVVTVLPVKRRLEGL